MNREISNMVVISQSNQELGGVTSISHIEGLLTSALLAQKLKHFKITISHICDEYSNQPSPLVVINKMVLEQLQQLGVPIAELIEPEIGLIAHATKYANWNKLNKEFWFSTGDYGVPFDGIHFHHYLSKLSQGTNPSKGKYLQIDNYSISSIAAANGRFSLPSNNPESIMSTLDYNLVCQANQLVKLLTKQARKLGVVTHSSTIKEVNKQANQTDIIASIRFDNDKTIKTDLIINCSNQRLECAEQSNQQSTQSDELMCKAIGHYSHKSTTFQTGVYAIKDGWFRLTSLGNISHFELHSNSPMDEETIKQDISEFTDSPITIDAVYSQASVHMNAPWQGNVINFASRSFSCSSPLQCSLQHVLTDCQRLLLYFPALDNCHLLSPLYNNKFKVATNSFAFYYLLPMHLQSNYDSDFWHQYSQLTESFDYQLDLFKQTGTLPVLEEQQINSQLISALLLNMGIYPESFHITLNQYSDGEICNRLNKFASFVQKSALSMPTYLEFIAHTTSPIKKQHVGVEHA